MALALWAYALPHIAGAAAQRTAPAAKTRHTPSLHVICVVGAYCRGHRIWCSVSVGSELHDQKKPYINASQLSLFFVNITGTFSRRQSGPEFRSTACRTVRHPASVSSADSPASHPTTRTPSNGPRYRTYQNKGWNWRKPVELEAQPSEAKPILAEDRIVYDTV